MSTQTIPAPRPRLAELLGALESGLVERRQAVRLALLAALAGEHTLLIGPPGTAKSELARRLHHAFAGASYFERLLTRFSVPEELFGPLSISALEQDRYERQTRGFLPEASIAFIDEVFKANSAILNALLTLLNEREFDNGAGRQRCPLISVIGATNEVPDDEVGEAFFDRFLVRLPIAPVSAEGFRELIDQAGTALPEDLPALGDLDRLAVTRAALAIPLPAELAAILGELRGTLVEDGLYVSDRRWVKIVWLIKIAAASEGRTALAVWDLSLLPYCLAPDNAGQEAIANWLAQRLGVDRAFAPPRLTRIVEAFEAQVGIEQDAEDLDYDASGRLKFSAGVGEQVDDAKHAATAPRMTYTRRRRYGATHIAARVGEVDALLDRIDRYADELAARRADLDDYAAISLWVTRDGLSRARIHLAETATALDTLHLRARAAREGFLALPRLVDDPGEVPAPIAPEALPA